MTAHSHDKRHDGAADMTVHNQRKPLLSSQLPLLGSNQDSSDPESGQRTATLDSVDDWAGQKAPVSDTTHTITHTANATAGVDEARIEAFLIKKWCYREYKKALRSGRLIPGPCFADNADCRSGSTHGHHHDYRYPRDVVWVCGGHHVALDRLRRAGHTLASAMVEVLLSTAPAPPPRGVERGSV